MVADRKKGDRFSSNGGLVFTESPLKCLGQMPQRHLHKSCTTKRKKDQSLEKDDDYKLLGSTRGFPAADYVIEKKEVIHNYCNSFSVYILYGNR